MNDGKITRKSLQAHAEVDIDDQDCLPMGVGPVASKWSFKYCFNTPACVSEEFMLRTWKLLIWIVVSIFGLSGCAGTRYASISQYEATTKEGNKVSGIRYYNDAPFVLVYSDGKGGLAGDLIWLPDTTQIRIIKPYAWMAKNDATYTFNNGVLTSAASDVDETVVPAAVISAAKDIVLSLIPNADAGQPPAKKQFPSPALFRVIVTSDGSVLLRGSYGLNPDGKSSHRINITVSQPAKTAEGGQ